MALLGLRDVSFSFTASPFLEHASLTIESGERVAILGRNGAGKSTLLKLIDGTLAPDQGEVIRQSGLRISRLDQEIPRNAAGTIYDLVAGGLGENGALVSRYHQATLRVAEDATPAALAELGRLHEQLTALDGWEIRNQVESLIDRLALNPAAPCSGASGGELRQALLARALISRPDLLVLDEPTNHLDVATIEWLEALLIETRISLCFITHDRAFLQRVATRIVEVDRGKLVDWGTDYASYLERKEAALAVEAREWAEFDRKLAQEETWIRTGIKARRTRNEGRVRALESLRLEREARRQRTGSVRLQVQEAERSGRLVIEARNLSLSLGGHQIISDCTTTILRGDRVGIVGPNGAGKSTLLQLLLGQREPDSGTLRHGTNLSLIYFDQMREQLDPSLTPMAVVGGGSDQVEINGQRRHLISYLQDFLFTPEQARSPIWTLSGGERNRLLLARLFTSPGNLLVLDEPTNDLDLETLELLEELLLNYAGTLLVVSHDRAFLDQLVTQTLVFEGAGQVKEYVGGYSDWLRQRPPPPLPDQPRTGAAARSATPIRRKRLSMAEAAELQQLPDQIDQLERERETLYQRMADPELLREGQAVLALREELSRLQATLEARLARWELLEEKAQAE